MMACLLFAVSSCEEDFTAKRGENGKGVGSIDGELLGEEKSFILVAKTDLPEGLQKKITAMGGEIVSVTPQAGIAVVKSGKANFKSEASKLAGIQQVVSDFKIQLTAPTKNVKLEDDYQNPPNSGNDDRFFDLQWGHDAVDAVEAWNAGNRGAGARVAVLDGGFDLDHPDLAPNIDMDASANFVDGEDLEYGLPDTFSHGTHVAGTVAAADNGFGIIGVAPEATLILVKVLGDGGSGSFADVISGIIHAADVNADVINMSLGAYFFKNGGVLAADGQTIIPIPANEVAALKNAMQKAVNYAYGKGVTIIASAGNDAVNGQADGSGLHLPSDLAKVVNTSATAPLNWAGNPSEADFGRLASYSNFGNKVDFAAPGGDSAYPGNELCTVGGLTRPCWVFDLVFSTGNGGWYWSAGTSMASPHASGVAAIIIGANGGDMSPAQVEAAMKEYAIDIFKTGRDPQSGHGQVNAVMD
jgi:subtilisin family serine protease